MILDKQTFNGRFDVVQVNTSAATMPTRPTGRRSQKMSVTTTGRTATSVGNRATFSTIRSDVDWTRIFWIFLSAASGIRSGTDSSSGMKLAPDSSEAGTGWKCKRTPIMPALSA